MIFSICKNATRNAHPYVFSLLIVVLFAGNPTAAFSQPASSLAEIEDHPPLNVLIAISDDQSFPHTSAYGSKMVDTPHFDRVAREGALFMNAFVASPGCSPSRAALLTGRYPWQIEHAGTHASYFPEAYVVFPDLLEEAGFHIGFTGKGWGPGDWSKSGRSRNPAGPEFNELTTEAPDGINDRDYSANFEAFLDARPEGAPFYFWYGAHEPHRVFKEGIGVENGKSLYQAEVPGFLPDAPETRNDLLDYAYEIEHFDTHLGNMLALLEEFDELDNTLVIVTSDNGMAFPRAKANAYEYGIHVPLAIRAPLTIPAGTQIDSPVSLVDLHPTILASAKVTHPTPDSLAGQNLIPLIKGIPGPIDARPAVYSGRERHSSSRFNSLSYPQRAVRTSEFLLIRNFTPERWPAGAPAKYNPGGYLGPMHGGYHDIDACPTLTYLIEHREAPNVRPYFYAAVNKRPAIELYDIKQDAACMINLAGAPGYQEIRHELEGLLYTHLRETADPRLSDNPHVFDTYPRVSSLRWFPVPDWVTQDNQAYAPEWLNERKPEWMEE